MEWLLEQQAVYGNYSNNIFYKDEAQFTLRGYVNKQNCRIWDSVNPQIIEETSLHPEKVTVWCALWPEGEIGPYLLNFKVDSERQIF